MMTSPLAAKTTPIHLLLLENFPIYDQLRVEEALLRVDDRNWCVLNIGSPPAIVMGISGKAELLIDRVLMHQCPVPLIRRFSGGGTVFVDHNTCFVTWICNTEHTDVACCPSKVHQWTEKFYQSAFPSLEMCLQESDYVIGNRKFGGNAQYLSKKRWLHHSSLLWDYNLENMRYLLMPKKIPLYRQQRFHEEFLCRLRDYFPTKESLKEQIHVALYQHFHIEKGSLEEVMKLTKLEHRKATHLVDF